MYKNCIIWIFLFSVISSNFSGLLVYAGYEMNRDYITSTFCVNKTKPWMNCNGKCYLMRKVREAEKNENNQAAKLALSSLSVTFCQKASVILFSNSQTLIDSETGYMPYNYSYTSQYITQIFRPPKSEA